MLQNVKKGVYNIVYVIKACHLICIALNYGKSWYLR